VAQAWSAVKDTNAIRTLEAFRRQYGALNPLYDPLAETRIDDLKRSQVAVANSPAPGRRDGVEAQVGRAGGFSIATSTGIVCPDR
jgi:hypothetical protein